MGVTAVRASKQYGDTELLLLAQDNWAYGAAYTLTQAQLNSGSTPQKDFTLKKMCQQGASLCFLHSREDPSYVCFLVSMAGATFHVRVYYCYQSIL